jgi:hypothetical protein
MKVKAIRRIQHHQIGDVFQVSASVGKVLILLRLAVPANDEEPPPDATRRRRYRRRDMEAEDDRELS